jgi:hypothetical protein
VQRRADQAATSSFEYDADGNVLVEKDPGTTTLYLPGEQLALNTSTQAVTGTRYYTLPAAAPKSSTPTKGGCTTVAEITHSLPAASRRTRSRPGKGSTISSASAMATGSASGNYPAGSA